MSTLKVNTIQNTSAAHSSTPEEIAQGRAKAWINFNGTGTVAIRDSFNVSSLTDNGTGDYSMNFSSAMSDANYCVASTGSESGVGGLPRFVCGDGNSTSAALLLTFNSSSKLDYQFCSYVVFGDQ